MILKIFITTPNLTSNFETHKDVGDKFWLGTYISGYIHNLYTQKVWRKLKDTFDTPSIHPPIRKLGASRLAVRAFTGLPRDIVVA